MVGGDHQISVYMVCIFKCKSLYQKMHFYQGGSVYQNVPKTWKNDFKITNLTVEFVFFVYLIPFSFLYLKATIESGQVSPACGLPMYYVQSAPFFCFILTAFRIVQRWFGEWRILLGKEKKPLEEGDIASVIEEAVVENPEHADAANMDKSGVTVRKEK